MQKFFPVLLWLGLLLGVYLFRTTRNRSAAQSGTDKANVRTAAQPLLTQVGAQTLLYAHWEEREQFGRGIRTTFYRYAVTFRDRELYILPLQVDKRTRQVKAGQASRLTAAMLGKVAIKTKEANGALRQLALHFYDKEGRTILQLTLDAQHLRKNRWYPLNILQAEELEAFRPFILSLAQQVEAENPGIDALLEAQAKEGIGMVGIIFSALGAFFTLFAPPVGVVMALVGLVIALFGKLRGAKSNKGLIITALCSVWAVFFTWFYINYLFV